jgi:hypothetical protein
VDFHKRAKSLGRQHEFEYQLVLVERGHNRSSFAAKMSKRYNASKCAYRIGIGVSDQIKMSVWFHKPIILVFAVSTLVVCKCRHVQKFRYPDARAH